MNLKVNNFFMLYISESLLINFSSTIMKTSVETAFLWQGIIYVENHKSFHYTVWKVSIFGVYPGKYGPEKYEYFSCGVSRQLSFKSWLGYRTFHLTFCRSSHLQVFFKIAILKNFVIFTGKHLCWSLFLIKLQTFRLVTLSKRDSYTGVFLWIMWNF